MRQQSYPRANRRSALRNSSAIAAVLAAAFGLAPASEAAAQPAATSAREMAGAQLEEVIVTARRREERLQDAPVAVTAITGQQLQNYNVVAVNDLAKFVPTMVVGRQVTGSSASIFLRGIGSSSLSAGFDQSVSFNIDGIAMSRGREIALTQYDLSNVQVLKGPQALFFGKNATGGVIAIESNNPTREFAAAATVGYGFEGREIYGEGFVSGPITDNLGARLAFRAQHSEGFFKNTAQTVQDLAQVARDPRFPFVREPTNSRRGGNEAISARLTLEYDPTERLELNLKLTGTRFEDDGASDNYERKCAGGRTTPAPTSGVANPFADCFVNGRADHLTLPVEVARTIRYAGDGQPFTRLTSGSAVLNAQYDAEWADLRSITAYYGFAQKASDDFNGGPRTIWNTQLSTMRQFSQELRLQTKFDSPLNIVVGGYYSDVNFHYNIDSYIFAVPFDPVTQTYALPMRNAWFDGETLSGYVEGIWTPTPEIEVSGGVRYSHESKDSVLHFLRSNPALGNVFGQDKRVTSPYREKNWSPEATIRWKPNVNLTAYAAYKEGFKAGGYNLSQSLSNTITEADARAQGEFKAETVSGFEGGLRTQLLNGRVHFNVTIYDYKYKDLQVQFYNPETISMVVGNAGSLTVKGVESDFAYSTPLEGLTLHGAIAYNDATFHNFIGSCYGGQDFAGGCDQLPNAAGIFNGQVFSGRAPPKAPKVGAQLGAAYDFPLSQQLSGRLTADANYSSKYNYTDTLRPDAVQESFTRVDASLAIYNEEQGWRVSFIGRNLTDELVVTSANDMTFTGGTGTGSPNPIGVPSDLNTVVERGREFYVEVRKTF